MDFRTYEPTRAQLRSLDISEKVENLCAVFQLHGAVLEQKLNSAIKEVIKRTPPFFYRFVRIGDSQKIFVNQKSLPELNVIETPLDSESSTYSMIRNICDRRFRLDAGEPYIFCLLKDQSTSYLIFVCHPSLIDRFSLKPLFTQISQFYNGTAISALANPNLSLGLDQTEILEAEGTISKSAAYQESLRFWKQILADTSYQWHPPRLDADLTDSSFTTTLGEGATERLGDIAKIFNVTTDELVLFSFHIFLSRISRSDTILTSYSHRIRTGLQNQIGFNENKPFFKSVINSQETVREYLKHASRLFSQCRLHSDILADFPVNASGCSTNIHFSDDYLPYEELNLDAVTATLLPVYSHRREGEGIVIHFDVRKNIGFHVQTRNPQEVSGLKMTLEHYMVMLENLPAFLDQPISELEFFNSSLKKKALAFADGGALKPHARDVMESFFETAKLYGSKAALRYQNKLLTYSELADNVRKLGSAIQEKAKTGSLVGICLSRSEKPVQAILGALAAGVGYVPLDSQIPEERLNYIINDSSVSFLIVDATTKPILEKFTALPLVDFDSLLYSVTPELDIKYNPQDIAYLIYTSGTTGKPKGVIIERGNLAHYLASLDGVWERGTKSCWLQFASFTFDASVLDTYNPIIHGAELVVAPDEVRSDPEALFQLLSQRQITQAYIPPAILPLLPRRPLPFLRTFFCGGEALEEEAARFWSKSVELVNCYGPTEVTVMATQNSMGGYKSATNLGRPTRGYKTYILDSNLKLTPLGGIGEICIGGEGLARGYLNRPDLTAQKFLPNVFASGRIYKTGDLARFLPNGELEFLGRSDFQIKIRGFRIEIGEIESVMSDQPEIQNVHVDAVTLDGNKILVGWYLSNKLSEKTLRTRLEASLPAYMVPTYLIRMDSFPLNLSGKIDRAKLPSPGYKQTDTSTDKLDLFQNQIREIWAEVLKLKPNIIHLDSQFFHLGGHSLLVALVCNRLSRVLKTAVKPKLLFTHPVFSDFCLALSLLPKTSSMYLPLTLTNQNEAPVPNRLIQLIYSRGQTQPLDNMYNIVTRIDFTKELHTPTLGKALCDCLSSNPIFSGSLFEKEGRVWIKTEDTLVDNIDIIQGDESVIENKISALRSEAMGVSSAPLWRAVIFEKPDLTKTLLFSIQHALFDGWSLNLFTEELADRYNGCFSKPQRLNWIDYCLWAQTLPESKPYKEAIQYWKQKLGGVETHVNLPLDFQHKKSDSNLYNTIIVDPKSVRALKQGCEKLGVTLPPFLFSIYLLWLWRLSDQKELLCGYPYAGRDIPGTEEIFGTFVSMGFLWQEIKPNQPLGDLIRLVHAQMIEDKEHLIAAPYDAEISQMESLNVLFSLQTGISLDGDMGPAKFKAIDLPSKTSKVDLAGIFYETENGEIEGRIEFDGSLFSSEKMTGFISYFKELIKNAAKNTKTPVSDIGYLPENEQVKILQLGTGYSSTLDTSRTVAEKFNQIAKAYPLKAAIVSGNGSITYKELSTLSDSLAEEILQSVLPGARIGLSLPRGRRAITSILAILKAGCVYVPLDPNYPKDRIKYFIENTKLEYVIADDTSYASLLEFGLKLKNISQPKPDIQTPRYKAEFCSLAQSYSTAYIIHTSGSTGLPKGVMIENHSIVEMINGCRQMMNFDENALSLQVASLNFDASILEIFLPLLTGATVFVAPNEAQKDPSLLHQFIKTWDLTHVALSPVVLQSFPREELPSLKFLGFGGDSLDESTAQWWSKSTPLYSLYGPTETTVQASIGRIIPDGPTQIIGKPVGNYKIYILNEQKQMTPLGAVGEIAISGPGLAQGYLNREDLTMEKFILDPFDTSPYALMYMTGDRGRFLADGNIEFLGRIDSQIKIRGYRIELGEIENQMSLHPEVVRVACQPWGEGARRYLVGYYVAPHKIEDFSHYLSKFLPEHMIPSRFVKLESIPTTSNGKINRRALPEAKEREISNPPRTPLEADLAKIWETLLKIENIGRDENFFHLGGNSLLVMKLRSEVKARLGLDTSVSDFYNSPTIESQAAGRSLKFIDLAVKDSLELGPHSDVMPAPFDPEQTEASLLTGAAGFLGIYLLHEIIKFSPKAYCLIRCRDHAEGLAMLNSQATRAGLEIDFHKIEIVPGNLEKDKLGLSEEIWQELCEKVTTIYHCGALVHHLHGYQSMRSANVLGTKSLLELAIQKRAKKFCFISTQTVPYAQEGKAWEEESILSNRPVTDNGYVLTKWVSEQLIALYSRKFGIPTLIARAGNITGDSTTGFSNFVQNHFWLFIKGCIQMGAFPATPIPIEMTPVDILAQAVMALSLKQNNGLFVAHLSNPNKLSQSEFFEIAGKSFSLMVKKLEPSKWQKILEAAGNSNAMATLKEYYDGDLSSAPSQCSQTQTINHLKSMNINVAADYKALIPIYLKYLSDQGFLSKNVKQQDGSLAKEGIHF